MMYGLEAMKNSIVRAENAARRAAEAKKRAGSDSARENELNTEFCEIGRAHV